MDHPSNIYGFLSDETRVKCRLFSTSFYDLKIVKSFSRLNLMNLCKLPYQGIPIEYHDRLHCAG